MIVSNHWRSIFFNKGDAALRGTLTEEPHIMKNNNVFSTIGVKNLANSVFLI